MSELFASGTYIARLKKRKRTVVAGEISSHPEHVQLQHYDIFQNSGEVNFVTSFWLKLNLKCEFQI